MFPDSIPKRADFVYVHPSTQNMCGFTIGDAVLIFSHHSVAVAVPWPMSNVPLDSKNICILFYAYQQRFHLC